MYRFLVLNVHFLKNWF